MCSQLLLDRISYTTDRRFQSPEVFGMQYPDILHWRKPFHGDRLDAFAQGRGLKYQRHHQPQSSHGSESSDRSVRAHVDVGPQGI